MHSDQIVFVRDTTSGGAAYDEVTADPTSLASLGRDAIIVQPGLQPLGMLHLVPSPNLTGDLVKTRATFQPVADVQEAISEIESYVRPHLGI